MSASLKSVVNPRSIAPHSAAVTPNPIRVYRVPSHSPPPAARLLAPGTAVAGHGGSGASPEFVQECLELELPHAAPTGAVAPSVPTVSDAPAAESFAGRLGVTVVEVVRGGRTLSTVARHVGPDVMSSLERRRIRPRSQLRLPPVRLRRVVGSSPSPGVYDAAVICEVNGRIHTLAMRLMEGHGKWVATELLLD